MREIPAASGQPAPPVTREQADWAIRFDYHGMTAEAIGGEHGVSEAELGAAAEAATAAHATVGRRHTAGELAWLDLPEQRDEVREVETLAAEIRERCDTFVVLGIGGSALGNTAVHTALAHPFHNLLPRERRGGPRLFVLDNVDPSWLAAFHEVVDLRRTVFNVITKSGSTAETMAQLQCFAGLLRDAVGGPALRDHLIATTDPRGGDLRRLVEREGLRSLAIPPGVGGRFSVLSAVGLLSAAVAGIDVRELLAGAASAVSACAQPDPRRNPALMNATLQWLLYRRGKVISVMMPYSQRLRDLADWFRQLWAESLGKRLTCSGEERSVGPTPIKALGVTDQHSQVQLYVEGPNNKVINFLSVARFDRDLAIPETFAGLPSASYLAGHTFGELMHAEERGTAIALTAARRPHCTHLLPEVRAHTVGQLLMLLQLQTAYAGELFEVNAYDQPGVEAGKIAAFALMGRPGYEQQRAEISAAARPHGEHVSPIP
ncbi:MAG: glucose-6-phosphate isomerase [Chloroflexi bacterium]|nr:glucose-6-phosphate isomerase [Chloroflexota bacterium]